jgi:hypothetical protein
MMDGGLERLRGHDLLYKVLFQGTFPSNIRTLTEVISSKRCSKLENRDLGIAKMFGYISRGIHVVCVWRYHVLLSYYSWLGTAVHLKNIHLV